MAIHDPDASAQEKAQALKLSRQKRIQFIDGQQVEMYTGELDEDDIMAVQGQDGNQYVVLEVIQLQVIIIKCPKVLFFHSLTRSVKYLIILLI